MIYPLVAHGVYGGGLLADVGGKPVMDFAGSSVVHLTGAVGALAALLLLGPRIGKYAPTERRGRSRGTRCRWSGSASRSCGSAGTASTPARPSAPRTTSSPRSRSTPSSRPLPARSRRRLVIYLKTQVGRRRHGRQRRDRRAGRDHGTLGIRRVLGGADHRRGRRRDRRLRRPRDRQAASTTRSARSRRTVSPASGARWRSGCSPPPRLILDGAAPGVWYGIIGDASLGATVGQFGVQAVGVAAIVRARVRPLLRGRSSLIKMTIGLRVSEDEELAGLDIASHGMYGYPESFIPPGGVPGWRPAAEPCAGARPAAVPAR